MIDDNVAVVDGKLHYESLHTLDFTHHATIKGWKLTSARFPTQPNVVDDNVVVLHGKLPYES